MRAFVSFNDSLAGRGSVPQDYCPCSARAVGAANLAIEITKERAEARRLFSVENGHRRTSSLVFAEGVQDVAQQPSCHGVGANRDRIGGAIHGCMSG